MAIFQDSFTRADESPIGSTNWETITAEVGTVSDLQVVSNAATGTVATQKNVMAVKSTAFSPASKSVYAQWKIGATSAGNQHGVLLHVRNGTTSDVSGIACEVNTGSGGFEVKRFTSGWNFNSSQAVSGARVAGDVVRFELHDLGTADTLVAKVFVNGIQVGTNVNVTYGTALSAGLAGAIAYNTTTGLIDDFESGDLDTTAPTFTSGPKAKAVISTGYQIEMTADENCTARLIVTAPGASQPNNAAFDGSTESVSLTAGVAGTVTHTG